MQAKSLDFAFCGVRLPQILPNEGGKSEFIDAFLV